MDVKADVWTVLGSLGVPMDALTVTADAPSFYHPGQSGRIWQGPKTVLATFGALHPEIIRALDLPSPAVAFEINLDAINEPKQRKKRAPNLPNLQPVKRDFAFLVDSAVEANNVLRAVRGADRDLIVGVSLFDLYTGDNVPDGKKSLAVEIVIQPRDHTLTDAEINTTNNAVITSVAKATGGVLR